MGQQKFCIMNELAPEDIVLCLAQAARIQLPARHRVRLGLKVSAESDTWSPSLYAVFLVWRTKQPSSDDFGRMSFVAWVDSPEYKYIGVVEGEYDFVHKRGEVRWQQS